MESCPKEERGGFTQPRAECPAVALAALNCSIAGCFCSADSSSPTLAGRLQLSPAPGSSTLPALVRCGRSAPSSRSSSAGRREGGEASAVISSSRGRRAGQEGELGTPLGADHRRQPVQGGTGRNSSFPAASAGHSGSSSSLQPARACVGGAGLVAALLVVLQRLVPLRLELRAGGQARAGRAWGGGPLGRGLQRTGQLLCRSCCSVHSSSTTFRQQRRQAPCPGPPPCRLPPCRCRPRCARYARRTPGSGRRRRRPRPRWPCPRWWRRRRWWWCGSSWRWRR